MAHTMQWVIDKRVLHVVYDGNIDQNELLEINEGLAGYLKEGIAPIHIISDNSKTQKVDMSIKAIQNSFPILSDKRWGWMCVLGAGTIVNFFVKVVSNSFRLHVKMLGNLEEAQKFLARNDETLT